LSLISRFLSMDYHRIGQQIIKFDRLGSTNDYASLLLSEGVAENGMIIFAHEQFGGRGQRGRSWYAAPGDSLTFSLIFTDLALSIDRVFMIQIVAGIAIRRWLSRFVRGKEVRLKWPNDVMVYGKKISGILTETQIQGSRISSVILGIGINLNQTVFPSGCKNPVSLYMISGKKLPVERSLQSLCLDLRQVFEEWISGGDSCLLNEYESCFYGMGELIQFNIRGQMLMAIPRGIDKQGSLILEKEDGATVIIDSASVEWF
jgi:BirA family biotin operon repressor/biotin-[acetyl-CoA-carboxylase] ligase